MAPWPLWIQGQGAKVHRLPLLVLIQSLVKRGQAWCHRTGFFGDFFFWAREIWATEKWSAKETMKNPVWLQLEPWCCHCCGFEHRENREVEVEFGLSPVARSWRAGFPAKLGPLGISHQLDGAGKSGQRECNSDAFIALSTDHPLTVHCSAAEPGADVALGGWEL